MKITDLFKKKKPESKSRAFNFRNFASAKYDNLFYGWRGTDLSADKELINNLQTMRNRVRQVCNDDVYARKFLSMVKSNVIGSDGIILQSKAKQDDGSFDTNDIRLIESAWKEWGAEKRFCSADRRLNWRDMQRIVVETLARDGECFIRMIRSADNPFSFSLFVMEGDWFDLRRNYVLDDKRVIRMSIEQNSFGEPLAYYQLTHAPENGNSNFVGEAERVPVDEIIHVYMMERPGQSRGIPWMNTALRGLEMLHQYHESELVASRIGSSSMGFFTSPDAQGYTGTDKDPDGNLIQEFQPGTFQQLPDGVEFTPFTPNHPTNAFPTFVKSILRSISSGLGVSYNAISSDLESVNFSSIRAGVMEERIVWQTLQNFMIEHFCKPVFKNWLRMAIASGKLPLPMQKIEKFEEVSWVPRGWSYVDPLKEINAHKVAVEMGVESLSEIASSKGKDLVEIFEQIKREKELAESLGISLPSANETTEKIEVEDDER
jgi:lambda family phage portal protein|tara:strand:+ start:2973 stop:4439 length:1467 start_codon:yes stop_codon:yes gene_type:complete